MLTQQNATVSLNSFREQSTGKRLVFFYPWANYRVFFLTHYLSNGSDGLLYFRVPGDVRTLYTFLSRMVGEFSTVLGNFGAKVGAALSARDPGKLGEALAADLNALPNRPIIFYIDEFEQLPVDSDLLHFLGALVTALNEDVQIALNSRLLADSQMRALVEQGDASVLATEQHRQDLSFIREMTPKPQLEVYALGRGSTLLNGSEISVWDGVLPRSLFFYLIDHPLVMRDEIFADFWPDVSLKDATDIFHVTKHKVTEVIGRNSTVPGDYEITQYKQGFYLPSENLIRHYDVESFQSAVEQAFISSDPREIEIQLRHALDVYQGHYLQESDATWAVQRREYLVRLHCEACIWMARILEQRGESLAALELYATALDECPRREDVHRSIIRLYLLLGRVDQAREQYHVLEGVYQKLGIQPSRESLELLRTIESSGAKPSR